MKKYIFILLIIFNTFISSALAQLQESDFNTQYAPIVDHSITNLMLYEEDTIDDCNFDRTHFRYIDAEWGISRCSFKNCIFQCGYLRADETNDYTNAYFAADMEVSYHGPKSFIQTRNYAKKVIFFDIKTADYSNFDFSDFTISSYFRVRTEGAKFHNTWFKNAVLPKYLTQEQIKQTKNYQTGVFHGISFWEYYPYELKLIKVNVPIKPMPELQQIFQNLDISGMTFSFCELYGSFSGTNMTDTVFTESDLSTVEDLTIEQVKSTWNYKAGRMSLCKWPEYIEKALEEEEKAKAQEEKK